MPGIAAQISTVLTAATSYNLVDLPTVKTLLNIQGTADDAYYNLVIAQASAACAQFANQPFVVEALQSQFFPQRDGWPSIVAGGKAVLQVKRWPVLASIPPVVTETIVGVATLLVQGTDYLVDFARGQFIRLDLAGYPVTWATNPVVITYSAGYNPVPPDVADAATRLVKSAWYARSRDPMLRSQHADGIHEASYFFSAGPGSIGGLPPDVANLLDNYRVPVFT